MRHLYIWPWLAVVLVGLDARTEDIMAKPKASLQFRAAPPSRGPASTGPATKEAKAEPVQDEPYPIANGIYPYHLAPAKTFNPGINDSQTEGGFCLVCTLQGLRETSLQGWGHEVLQRLQQQQQQPPEK